MFPRWKYSLFQSWFRRTLAFQKPLAFLSRIINCFTNIFDGKQLKYSPKVYIFALRCENGNSRRNEPLFLVSVDKLPTCYAREQVITVIWAFPWFVYPHTNIPRDKSTPGGDTYNTRSERMQYSKYEQEESHLSVPLFSGILISEKKY
jgi:hypothetical protein